MAKLITRGQALFVLSAIVVQAGCAQFVLPKMEYRGGLALYNKPRFSFQLPEGWRPATGADWSRFSVNQRLLDRLNERGRAQFEENGRIELARYPAALIHPASGAWMSVQPAENKGTKFRSGQGLTDIERDNIWRAVEKAMIDAAVATDKPKFTLEYMDVVDHGPNTGLSLIMTRMDRRGTTRWNLLSFFSETHVVTVEIGMAERDPSVVDGLDLVGRTFRFE